MGKQADLLILEVDDYRHLAYRVGENLVETVIKRGEAEIVDWAISRHTLSARRRSRIIGSRFRSDRPGPCDCPYLIQRSLARLVDRRLLNLSLIAVLLAGLALRLLLWGNIPRSGLISDEGEYLSAASWLAHGHGFDWYQGYLWTRAPLYPLFLALHLRLFGDTLTPIYLTQTLLSLLNVALVYFLARQLAADHRRPTTVTDRRHGARHRRPDH